MRFMAPTFLQTLKFCAIKIILENRLVVGVGALGKCKYSNSLNWAHDVPF